MHAALLLLVVSWQPSDDAPAKKSMYNQLIATHEQKLVWYKLRDKLPDVTAPEQAKDSRPPKAEVKIAKQSIVSSPKNAPKAQQMVWQPAPRLEIQKDVFSPNILAMNLPDIPPPAVKQFEPPKPVEHTKTEALQPLPDAPALQAKIDMTTAVAQPLPKVYKEFVPPPTVSRQFPTEVSAMPSAPALAAMATRTSIPGSALNSVARPFVPPPARTQTGTSKVAAVAAPAMDLPGSRSTLNAAVVGLSPTDKLLAPLPPVSRPARFSAGPKLNPDGGAGDGKTSGILTVPDLFVRGASPSAHPTLVARVNPTSPEALRATTKYATTHDAIRPSGLRVSSAPDPRFAGRQVYSMAVQMPNITSYIGSWLMWYAERTPTSFTSEGLTPPIPHHKVDPKYVPTAVEDRIEGSIRLACVIRKDGHVDLIETVKGLDDRLNRTATEAMSKWQFAPAMRNGVPVDVDVLVEIPFRLAPLAKR